MFLSIVFVAAAAFFVARRSKDRLLAVIGLAITFSIIEAFFAPALALTSIGLAVLAFFTYVISKADWMVAFTPLSNQEMSQNHDEFRRSHAAVEVE